MTLSIYIRLSFLIEDVEGDMGPTALLPGAHGTHVDSLTLVHSTRWTAASSA